MKTSSKFGVDVLCEKDKQFIFKSNPNLMETLDLNKSKEVLDQHNEFEEDSVSFELGVS